MTPGDLWGWGRFGDEQLLPLSFDDIRRDAMAARAGLRSLALPSDAKVVVVSTVSEFGHFWPVLQAAHDLGYVTSTADATPYDAGRTEMFCRLLSPSSVIGLDDAVLDGLEASGLDPGSVFARVSRVVARGQAVNRLRDAGVGALRWVALGPTTAMDCRHGHLHYDRRQWRVESEGGRLVLSSTMGRAYPVDHLDTGLRGTVSARACPCTRSDPTLELAVPT
jgi:hypothetical protein